MCFSAKASFIAAGALSGMGALSVHKARKHKRLIPFASTPLIVAFQQLNEGIVWLTLTTYTDYTTLHRASMYTFVFFAGSWWPIWLPFTLYLLEENPRNKKLLLVTVLIGALVSCTYTISLLTQHVTVTELNHHLYYPTLSYLFYSSTPLLVLIENSIPYLYFTSTIAPFFLSTISRMWLIGIVMGLSSLTSQLFYVPTSASVWCFFAAIISFLTYYSVCIMVKKYNHTYQ